MPGSVCVSITNSKNDTDKATVGFVVANAAVASDKDTMVFLSTEGVRLALKGYADDIHESGFAPLKELIDNFVNAGGRSRFDQLLHSRKIGRCDFAPGFGAGAQRGVAGARSRRRRDGGAGLRPQPFVFRGAAG